MSVQSKIKEQIKTRSQWIFLSLIPISILIIGQILNLQTKDKANFTKLLNSIEKTERTIPAIRGNIFASDGTSLLATSVPTYIVALDPKIAKENLFNGSIDALAEKLSRFFGDRSVASYKNLIINARKAPDKRYVRLNSKYINHNEKEIIEEFPLFKEGRKGGGIFERNKNRYKPFKNLAKRTIGDLGPDKIKGAYGLENSFNNYLKGVNGKGLYQKIAGSTWVPINSESDIEAEAGKDIITTLDINFQDIVEDALRKQVVASQAKYGSAIVMEIKTGEIKAIANLSRRNIGNKIRYIEDNNYAIAGGTDPGSTFKLPSILAILEKTNLPLTAYVTNCTGNRKYNNLNMTCSHGHGDITVQQVFEKSCNIGIFELMRRNYGFSSADDYIDYLKKFRLDKPLGFQIKGENTPIIKDKNSKTFSQTTIPWMSIGYETRLAPIQMLAFYNAVANDGYWVQPNIVKEVRQGNEIIQKFYPIKIEKPIISSATIKKAKIMLEGVVLRGTASNIKEGMCSIAGKTGTSQKRTSSGYRKGKYYTAFIGYFPAENPKYSCAIIIDEPIGNQYASQVSAPVFRNIADKIFAYDLEIHPFTKTNPTPSILVSNNNIASKKDIISFASNFDIKTNPISDGYSILRSSKKDSLNWKKIKENPLPDLHGMVLKDALPILENQGYTVKYKGLGRIEKIEFLNGKVVSLILK